MMKAQHEIDSAIFYGEYANRKRAYISVVSKDLAMWRDLVDTYASHHPQDEHETIDQYVARIAEQDFEDGLEACHFPGLYHTLDTYSERLATAMRAEAKIQPIEAILAGRAQVTVVDDESFKAALEAISQREHLSTHLARQTIEVRIDPSEPKQKSAVHVIHEALQAHGWTASVVLKSLEPLPKDSEQSEEAPQRPTA